MLSSSADFMECKYWNPDLGSGCLQAYQQIVIWCGFGSGPVLVGPRLESGCLQAYQWSVKRLAMGWGLMPIVPGLERGCFHRKKVCHWQSRG